MRKILPKQWSKEAGTQTVRWLEWDGHCMCTKVEKQGNVNLPANADLAYVADAIKNQIYGNDR